MIEVQNLSFAYGSRPILQNVSFSLEQGECVAVLGNNGAGKSTLISCITSAVVIPESLHPQEKSRGHTPERSSF